MLSRYAIITLMPRLTHEKAWVQYQNNFPICDTLSIGTTGKAGGYVRGDTSGFGKLFGTRSLSHGSGDGFLFILNFGDQYIRGQQKPGNGRRIL